MTYRGAHILRRGSLGRGDAMPLRHQLARCHVHQRALNSRAADIHPQYDRCCRRRACRRSWRLLSCRAGSTLAHKARQGGAAGGKARVGTQRPPRSQTGRLLAGGATEKTRGGGRRSSGLERGLEPPRGGDGDRHAGMHVVRARACVAGTSVRRAWRELLYCTAHCVDVRSSTGARRGHGCSGGAHIFLGHGQSPPLRLATTPPRQQALHMSLRQRS